MLASPLASSFRVCVCGGVVVRGHLTVFFLKITVTLFVHAYAVCLCAHMCMGAHVHVCPCSCVTVCMWRLRTDGDCLL